MGYTDELDVIGTLAALEMALAELGLRRRARPRRHRRPAGADRPGSPVGQSRSSRVRHETWRDWRPRLDERPSSI